jgi:hypothetical protein
MTRAPGWKARICVVLIIIAVCAALVISLWSDSSSKAVDATEKPPARVTPNNPPSSSASSSRRHTTEKRGEELPPALEALNAVARQFQGVLIDCDMQGMFDEMSTLEGDNVLDLSVWTGQRLHVIVRDSIGSALVFDRLGFPVAGVEWFPGDHGLSCVASELTIATISGLVTFPDGSPDEFGSVYAWDCFAETSVDEDGRFTLRIPIPSLPPERPRVCEITAFGDSLDVPIWAWEEIRDVSLVVEEPDPRDEKLSSLEEFEEMAYEKMEESVHRLSDIIESLPRFFDDLIEDDSLSEEARQVLREWDDEQWGELEEQLEERLEDLQYRIDNSSYSRHD